MARGRLIQAFRNNFQRSGEAQKFLESEAIQNSGVAKRIALMLLKIQHSKLVYHLLVCQGAIPVYPVADEIMIISDVTQLSFQKWKYQPYCKTLKSKTS